MWTSCIGMKYNPEFISDLHVVQQRIARLWRRAVAVWRGGNAATVPIGEGRFSDVMRKWLWRSVDGITVETQKGPVDLTRITKAALRAHAEHAFTLVMMERDKRCKYDQPLASCSSDIFVSAPFCKKRFAVPI